MLNAEPWRAAPQLNCGADGTATEHIKKKSNKIPKADTSVTSDKPWGNENQKDAVKLGGAMDPLKIDQIVQAAQARRPDQAVQARRPDQVGQPRRRNAGSGSFGRRCRQQAWWCRQQTAMLLQLPAFMVRLGADMTVKLRQCNHSDEDKDRVERCFEDLQATIGELLGPRWRLEIFGSVASGFSTNESDMDATCIWEKRKDGETEDEPMPDATKILVERLSPELRKKLHFEVTEEIPLAKVPLLRLRFEGLLDIDLTCNNTGALQNTRLLRAYAQLDPRVKDLGVAIKLWAKASDVCGAAKKNVSSYTFTLLMIYYMQVHQEVELPLLAPALFEDNADPKAAEAAIEFARDRWSNSCHLSLADLFFRFISFYTTQFEWGNEVACIRLGERRYSNDELFKSLRGRYVTRIHIEDPYMHERNLHCVLGEPEEEKLLQAFQMAWGVLLNGGSPAGLSREGSVKMELQLNELTGFSFSPQSTPQSSPTFGPQSSPHLLASPSPSVEMILEEFQATPTEVVPVPPVVKATPLESPGALSSSGSTRSGDGSAVHDRCPSTGSESRHSDDERAVAKPQNPAAFLSTGIRLEALTEAEELEKSGWTAAAAELGRGASTSQNQWWQNMGSPHVHEAAAYARPRVHSQAEVEHEMAHKQDIKVLAKGAASPSLKPASPPGNWWLNLGAATAVQQAPSENTKKVVLTVQDLEGQMVHEPAAYLAGISPLFGRSFAASATGKIASRINSKCFGHTSAVKVG